MMLNTERVTTKATLIYWYDTENINSIVAGLFIGDKMVEFKHEISLDEFDEFCKKYNLKKAVDKIEKI